MSETIRALENAGRLVRNIPLDRAAQGLMAARTANETAEADFQNKIRGLQMPGLELAANRDKRQLTRENTPFNLKRYIDMGGITGDQGAMLVQDQKNGMPVAFDHFAGNLKNIHGITFDENWNAVTKDGKPLTEAEAGPVLQEMRGTLGLYTNPVKAKDFKLATLQDKLSASKDKAEQTAIKSQIEQLKNVPDHKLLGQYIQDLQATIANHRQYGRDPSDAMMRLEWAMNEYEGAVNAEAKASDRTFELQKLGIQEALKAETKRSDRAHELKKLGIQEAGKDRRQKEKSSGEKDGRGSFQKDVEFYATATGIPVSEAAEMFRNDKTLAQRLRAASAEIEAFTNSMAGMQMDQDQMRMLIDDTYAKYQIGPVENQEPEPEQNNDPLGIR